MAEKDQKMMVSMRNTAAQAYGFVKGSESIESFAALTFEEAMQQQLDRLENGGEATLSALSQVDKIQTDLSKVVNGLQNAPATVEEALEVSDEENVNTPE